MDVSEYSLSPDAPANIYVHRGFILDQHVTGLVRNIPAPTPRYVAIEGSALFAEQFRRRQRSGREMRVLIERRGSAEPVEARVRCIDGAVMVLKDSLDFTPAEGACVQLLLGYRRTFIDATAAEKQEKEVLRWI